MKTLMHRNTVVRLISGMALLLPLLVAACSSQGGSPQDGCLVHQAPSHWAPASMVQTVDWAGVETAATGADLPTQTITLQRGQSIDFDMTSTIEWTLATSPAYAILQTAYPAGWDDTAIQACVWRFVGMGPGTTMVVFSGTCLLSAPYAACARVPQPPPYQITVV